MTRDASDEPIGIRNAMQKCPWKLCHNENKSAPSLAKFLFTNFDAECG